MKPESETSVFNEQQRERFASALERVGGDEEMLSMLAEMAAEDAPVLLNTLSSEIQAGFLTAAAQNAHALKGLLSTFETGVPVEDMQPLIDAARDNDRDQTSQLLQGLEPRLSALIAQITGLTRKAG